MSLLKNDRYSRPQKTIQYYINLSYLILFIFLKYRKFFHTTATTYPQCSTIN